MWGCRPGPICVGVQALTGHLPGGGLPAEAEQQKAEAAEPARGHGGGAAVSGRVRSAAAARPGPATIRWCKWRSPAMGAPANRSAAQPRAPPAVSLSAAHTSPPPANRRAGRRLAARRPNGGSARRAAPCPIAARDGELSPIRGCSVYSRLRPGYSSQSHLRGGGGPARSPPGCEGRAVSLLRAAAAALCGTGSGVWRRWSPWRPRCGCG